MQDPTQHWDKSQSRNASPEQSQACQNQQISQIDGVSAVSKDATGNQRGRRFSRHNGCPDTRKFHDRRNNQTPGGNQARKAKP
jgi:hypothetical protein